MGSRRTVKDKTSAASAMEANHNGRGKTCIARFGPFPAALIVHGQQRNSGQRHERSQGYLPHSSILFEKIDQGITDSGLHKKCDNKLSIHVCVCTYCT